MMTRKPNSKGPSRGILLDEEESGPQDLGAGTNDKASGSTSKKRPEQGTVTSSTMNASNGEAEASDVPLPATIVENSQAHVKSLAPRRVVKADQRSQDLTYGFHAFIWLNSEKLVSGEIGSQTDKDTSSTDEMRLKADLEEIVVLLSKKAGTANRHAFKCCPSQRRREVHGRILKEVNHIPHDRVVDQSERQILENKVEIWNKLSKLFQFFLPHNFEGPTTDKFWGAVAKLLDVSTRC